MLPGPRLVSSLVVLAAFLAGCTNCAPTTVPAVLSLSIAGEEVRTLPMLISDATTIAGVPLPIPDSHGWLDLRHAVSHNLSRVRVDYLEVSIVVDGRDIPIRLVHATGGDLALHGPRASGGIPREGVVRLWWAVDRDHAASAQDLVLPEGRPYRATVQVAWSHESCAYRANGDATADVDDFVQASANARMFQSQGAPRWEATPTNAGFRADLRVRSGLEATVTGAGALAVHLPQGAGAPAVVTFPRVGWSVNGLPGNQVTPRDAFQAFSATALSGAAYAPSGTFAPPGATGGPGLYVLVLDLRYRAADPTLGASRDTFAWGIVR
jgi:hypothetical protein